MYSHDGFGVGHLRRNTNIAARFVREMPDSSVLLLVGAPTGVHFQLPPGVDFMKLPSIIKVATGIWRPRTLHISSEETKAIRAATIQRAVQLFAPQLFLVDHIPAGVWGELLPTLQMLKAQKPRPKVVLGLRDILDAPEITRDLWRRERAYETIDRYYDQVFIYGCREVFATADLYGLTGALAQKVTYCGYVCSEETYAAKEQVRKELQISKDKLVVVTGGGGHDAFPMMRACLEAFARLGDSLSYDALIIAGPLMEHTQWESLRTQAEGLPVRVLRYASDNLALLNAADLVISMAGYNTLAEAVRLQKRLLVIPRQWPSAEQRLRAEIFSRLGLVHAIWPDQVSASRLAEAIRKNLDSGPIRPGRVSVDGLTKVVREMARLLRFDAPAMVAGD